MNNENIPKTDKKSLKNGTFLSVYLLRKPLDFTTLSELTFERLDRKVFRNLQLCYDAIEMGGNMPCILNAANEIAVELFLQNKIGFLQISSMVEQTMQKSVFIKNPTLEDYTQTDAEARIIATEVSKTI